MRERENCTMLVQSPTDCFSYLPPLIHLHLIFTPQPCLSHRFHSLSKAIKTAEQDSSIQSLVLQSSNPSVFSAGLDLMELHQPNTDRLEEFWSAFQQLYLDLYGSRLACIAAIQGHAPAAGCMLALSCDYRIMVGSDSTRSSSSSSSSETETGKKGPMIGLNESQLGIVAPPWLAQQMMDTIGIRRAELAMSLGKLYSPEEALAIQLVDEVVPTNKELVLEHAVEAALQWGKIPPVARVANKMLVRKKRMDHMIATRKEDLGDFCSFVTTDEVQKSLSMYLEMLAKKKAKK